MFSPTRFAPDNQRTSSSIVHLSSSAAAVHAPASGCVVIRKSDSQEVDSYERGNTAAAVTEAVAEKVTGAPDAELLGL